jgi:hypothetical protein
MINKKKIIYFLIAVIASLLLLNVLLALNQNKNEIELNRELTINKIEEKFYNVLNVFGIDDLWISTQKLKKGEYDSLEYKFIVKIPSGVAIPLVLKDLNEAFVNQPVTMASEEKKINGITSLNIESAGDVKLIAEFKYDLKLVREFSQVGFLLTKIDEIEDSEFNILYNIAFPFGVLLPLETNSRETAEIIKSNNINYFIELIHNSESVDFELDPMFSLEKLSKNIRNIISSFNSPDIFFIDDKKSKFDINAKNYIKEEFMKKNRRVISLNKYALLKGENKADLLSLMSFYLNNIKMGDSGVFRISANDFLMVQEEINKYVKKGNKILNPNKLF